MPITTNNTQLDKWPLKPNLIPNARKHQGLAPWCLHNISRWEWKHINSWLSIHSYCGQLTSIKKVDFDGLLLAPFTCTESTLWVDPFWQAACIEFIDALPKRKYEVELRSVITRKQANQKFTGNFEIFTGYQCCIGSFSSTEDAFLATLGWQ